MIWDWYIYVVGNRSKKLYYPLDNITDRNTKTNPYLYDILLSLPYVKDEDKCD